MLIRIGWRAMELGIAILIAGSCDALASSSFAGESGSSVPGDPPAIFEIDSRGAVLRLEGHLGQIALRDAGPDAARLMNEIASVLEPSKAARFEPVASRCDALGHTHVRVRQILNGLPVVGSEGQVHADPMGRVYRFDGTIVLDDGALVSALPADVVIGHALSELSVAATFVGSPTLTYVRTAEGRARLAWGFEVEYASADGPQRDRVFADAADGGVVARHPHHHFARNRKTYNLNHSTALPGVLARIEGQPPVADPDVNAAHDNAGRFYDYHRAKFGRDSFDDQGSSLTSSVLYSSNYAGVFWNGSQLVLGEGDGSEMGPPRALDLVAHEWTHAVTDHECDLLFYGESGAVSESLSDIFAANIEAWSDGGIGPDTWKIGEDCWTPGTPGDALRYMDNPTADGQSRDYYPDRYVGPDDNGGVHWNSGIMNLAYVLLVQGGTHPRGVTSIVVPALGMLKAEQIFYRAQTTYLGPNSDLYHARQATRRAAEDLYSQSEKDAVSLAWDAVGVWSRAVSVDTPEAGASRARIVGVAPNPFGRSTHFRLAWGSTTHAVIHVHDAGGRIVRKLIASGGPVGETLVAWDGSDDRGTRVSAGIYFARIAGAPATEAVRLAVVK